MHPYVDALLNSKFVFAPWVLGIVWVLLTALSFWASAQARAALAAQRHIVVDYGPALTKAFQPRFMVVQVLFAAAMLWGSHYIGELTFTFIGGGYVVALAVGLGLNLYSLLFARRLSRDAGVDGSVGLSAKFVVADIGYRSLGGALIVLISGLVFAQLALLGGALFLGSSGFGYVRKSRRIRGQA